MEAVITGVVDEYRIFRKRKELFILVACIACFLLGLPCVTQGGAFVLNLFDYQSGGVSLLFLGFFETVTLAWIYGTDRFSLDIEKMIGRRPGAWWWFCWRFCAPTIMAGIFLFSISQWSGVSYNDYKYPPWAEFLGWVIALSSMLFIPGVAIWQLYHAPGTFMEVSFVFIINYFYESRRLFLYKSCSTGLSMSCEEVGFNRKGACCMLITSPLPFVLQSLPNS